MRIKGLQPPCKDCPDREIGCHSNCENYKTFKTELDKRKKEDWLNSEGFIDWKRRKVKRRKKD